MIKKIILTLCCLASLSTMAQRRNNFQILGFGYDTWSSIDYEIADIGSVLIGRGTYSLGYERLIGKRIAVGVTYNHIFSSIKKNISANNTNYTPKQFNSKSFINGEHTLKGHTLGYESKYFFDDFDVDGANGFYVGFNYQYTSISESFDKLLYSSSSNNVSNTKLDPQSFGVNRFGIKFGYAATVVATVQIGLGAFYNSVTGGKDKLWKSPVDINNLSLNMYLVYGFAL